MADLQSEYELGLDFDPGMRREKRPKRRDRSSGNQSERDKIRLLYAARKLNLAFIPLFKRPLEKVKKMSGTLGRISAGPYVLNVVTKDDVNKIHRNLSVVSASPKEAARGMNNKVKAYTEIGKGNLPLVMEVEGISLKKSERSGLIEVRADLKDIDAKEDEPPTTAKEHRDLIIDLAGNNCPEVTERARVFVPKLEIGEASLAEGGIEMRDALLSSGIVGRQVVLSGAETHDA